NMLKVVDTLMIGGAMAYTFHKARGEETGKSLVEDDKLDHARELMSSAGEKLKLATDHIVHNEVKTENPSGVSATIPADQLVLDNGPETIHTYEEIIKGAKTVIWNGPMGVFEMPPWNKGTVDLAKAVAESGAVSVVGGGDSEKAIKSAGVTDKITHVS